MNPAESEDRFTRLHQVHPVARDGFKISRVVLKQVDLFLTFGSETLKILQMRLLSEQISFHVRKSSPLGIEGEAECQQRANNNQHAHNEHRGRKKFRTRPTARGITMLRRALWHQGVVSTLACRRK